MAIVRAVKTGNWSDTTVWNTGALPTAADDVYSNTFTVTIDTSPMVLSISNAAATGVTAGGTFVPNNGTTLTVTGAGVAAGAVPCFVSSLTTGQSCTLVGKITGGTGGTFAYGANNTSTGTLNIVGDVNGGTGNGPIGVNNNSTGTVNITGNCTASSANFGGAVTNAAGGTVNITGNCTGGGNAGSAWAAANSSTGVLNITGSIIGGSQMAGVINNSTGTMTCVGTAQASSTQPAIDPGASVSQITILTGPLICFSPNDASAGVNPCLARRWFPADTGLSTFRYEMRGQTTSGSPAVRPTRNLYLTNAYDAGYPAAGNVRSGTTYGAGGSLTGTCAVPPAASVGVGVPVDNTTGTAAITAASIRSAMGLAAADLDTQLAALPTAAEAATAVRSELATELGRVDATISSRLATSGYTAPPSVGDIATAVWAAATRTLTTAIDNSATIAAAVWAYASGRTITGGTVTDLTNAPDVPTEAEIATAVRTELSTELSRIDVATSTRLAAASYSAAPSAATTATAVRSELATELGRLDAAVSSRLAPAGTLARVTLVDTTTTVTNSSQVDNAAIADAVRVELTPELARVANAATTQEVGDIVEEAMNP
jgi:hypothetical protein